MLSSTIQIDIHNNVCIKKQYEHSPGSQYALTVHQSSAQLTPLSVTHDAAATTKLRTLPNLCLPSTLATTTSD